jgi:putative aminopeptidase FrvX
MKILHELCAVPTAPFAEGQALRFIDDFARARPRLRLSKDRFGNRLLLLPGTSRSSRAARLIFVAHTDHPGFVARRMIKRGIVEADFRGGVLREYVQGAKVRFFDGEREIPGVVISANSPKDRPPVPNKAHVRVPGEVSPGAAGMFDQGIGRVRDGKFYCRVCDDLAGAAAALTMLDQLHAARSRPRATVGVLLTRGEEEGFIGALAAVLHPRLLKKSDHIISIECSAMQPSAKQGDGVILRVGDRTSIFNSQLMYWMTREAEALSKGDKTFKHQRALMPGGSCEGTVFDAYKYTTGAACLALGNYHNMDREKKRIGPEYVDVNDWNSMVKLFVRLAQKSHSFEPGMKPLKQRLEKRFGKFRRLLK